MIDGRWGRGLRGFQEAQYHHPECKVDLREGHLRSTCDGQWMDLPHHTLAC